MPVDDRSVLALMKLGLTEYEARIYDVLIRYGPKKAGELSFFSKVPRPKTYGALQELSRKGLVEAIPERPERYLAASPNEKLFPVANKLMEETQQVVDAVQSLTLTYESLKYVHREKPPEKEVLWSVYERSNVTKMLNTMIEGANSTIRVVTSANGLVRYYKSHADLFEQARSRGVRISMIAAVTQDNQKVARELKALLNLKSFEDLPAVTYVSVDSREMLVVESSPDNYDEKKGKDIGVYTDNPLLVRMLEALFDKLSGEAETRSKPKA